MELGTLRVYLEEIGVNAGNWVDSALDRDYWRALVKAALNLRFPQSLGVSIRLTTPLLSVCFVHAVGDLS